MAARNAPAGVVEEAADLPGLDLLCAGILGVRRHPALGGLDVADDDGEQIVEIVRDAAGELAHRLHLLRLPELGFGAQALFHLLLEQGVGRGELGGAGGGETFEVLVGARQRLAGGDDLGDVGVKRSSIKLHLLIF